MSKYKGYLIANSDGGVKMPNSWIVKGSYRPTPNQRVRLKAFRDDYTQDLTMTTSKGLKSKIELTLCRCDLDAKMRIQSFFNSCLESAIDRTYNLKVWNDESNDYVSGKFYIPDITWNVSDADESTIYYDETAISIIQC